VHSWCRREMVIGYRESLNTSVQATGRSPAGHMFFRLRRGAAPSEARLASRDKKWCGREDSNFHGLPHSDLNAARLPIPPRPQASWRAAGIANGYRVGKPEIAGKLARLPGHWRLRSSPANGINTAPCHPNQSAPFAKPPLKPPACPCRPENADTGAMGAFIGLCRL
jgi:hypothetical protein